jgi:hypothetical protein
VVHSNSHRGAVNSVPGFGKAPIRTFQLRFRGQLVQRRQRRRDVRLNKLLDRQTPVRQLGHQRGCGERGGDAA